MQLTLSLLANLEFLWILAMHFCSLRISSNLNFFDFDARICASLCSWRKCCVCQCSVSIHCCCEPKVPVFPPQSTPLSLNLAISCTSLQCNCLTAFTCYYPTPVHPPVPQFSNFMRAPMQLPDSLFMLLIHSVRCNRPQCGFTFLMSIRLQQMAAYFLEYTPHLISTSRMIFPADPGFMKGN